MPLSYNSNSASPLADDALPVRLARWLSSRGIAQGSAIPSEQELGRAMAVGRQQLREALAVLEGFGVVTSRRGARRRWLGPDVSVAIGRVLAFASPSTREVAQVLEVRHALETSLLPQAIAVMDPDTVEALRELARGMVARAGAGLPFARLDREFHQRLLSPLSNGVLNAILAGFWVVYDELHLEGVLVEEVAVAQMHHRIVDAIESGDTRLAVHELDAHFFGVRRRLTHEGVSA